MHHDDYNAHYKMKQTIQPQQEEMQKIPEQWIDKWIVIGCMMLIAAFVYCCRSFGLI